MTLLESLVHAVGTHATRADQSWATTLRAEAGVYTAVVILDHDMIVEESGRGPAAALGAALVSFRAYVETVEALSASLTVTRALRPRP